RTNPRLRRARRSRRRARSYSRLHQLVPLAPEHAQMALVGGELLVAGLGHAARQVGPWHFAPGGEAELRRFERGNVVGRGEAARPVEGEKRVQPARALRLGILYR